MIVGLYDADFIKYGKVNFNLALMKVSRYYKNKKHIVVMMEKFEPWKVTKCYVFKDYDDGVFPMEFEAYDNVVCLGRAYHQNQYVPMDREIELCAPDTSIYEKLGKYFIQNKYRVEEQMFNSLCHAYHARFSLNGRSVWEDFTKPLVLTKDAGIFMCHDYNLANIEGAREAYGKLMGLVQRITKNQVYLGVKYPMIIDQPGILSQWADVPISSSFFEVEYNGMIENEELGKVVGEEYGSELLSKTTCNITRCAGSPDAFIEDILPNVVKQCTFLRRHRMKILLTYDRSFLPPIYEGFIALLNTYMAAVFKRSEEEAKELIEDGENNIISYVRSITNEGYREKNEKKYVGTEFQFSRDYVKLMFEQIRKDNYELFTLLYEDDGTKIEEELRWTTKI